MIDADPTLVPDLKCLRTLVSLPVRSIPGECISSGMIAKSRPISHIITDHLVEGSSFDQSGAYAIVHAVPQSLYEEPDTAHDDSAEDGSSYLAHQSSRLVYKSGFATSSVGVPDLSWFMWITCFLVRRLQFRVILTMSMDPSRRFLGTG